MHFSNTPFSPAQGSFFIRFFTEEEGGGGGEEEEEEEEEEGENMLFRTQGPNSMMIS